MTTQEKEALAVDLDKMIVSWCFFDSRCVGFKPSSPSQGGGNGGGSVRIENALDWPSWSWMRIEEVLWGFDRERVFRKYPYAEGVIKRHWKDGVSLIQFTPGDRRFLGLFLRALVKNVDQNPLKR